MVSSSSKLSLAKGSTLSLPFELVEEILEKTPIEVLLRSKSISKEWYGLFKNNRFIYKHLNLSQDNKRFIRIYHDMVQIINPVTLDLLSPPLPIEFHSSNTLLTAIHCDGLLLCRVRDESDKRMLAVWNPVLSSRVKWIEPLHSYDSLDAYGFGYDNDKNYKILRFYPLGKEYEIYNFKSKLWRAFPATFDNWFTTYTPYQNVSMKGNMYWIAQTKSNFEIFIQSFDFSKEIFKPICSSSFPQCDRVRFIYIDTLVLSDFGGDRLSLLHQHHHDDDITREIKIEVWVTNKVTDVVVSWSKYFNVTHPDLPILLSFLPRSHAYYIHKTNSIMLWCDKVVQQEDHEACASFYEIGDGEIKKQVETGPRYADNDNTCICGHVYVPSLVPLPE